MTFVEAPAGPVTSSEENAVRIYDFMSFNDSDQVLEQVGQFGDYAPEAPARLIAAIGNIPTLTSVQYPDMVQIGKALDQSSYSPEVRDGLENAVDTLGHNSGHELSDNAVTLLDAVFEEVVDSIPEDSDGHQIIGAPGVFIKNGVYIPGVITSRSVRGGMEKRLGELFGRICSQSAHKRGPATAWYRGHIFENGLSQVAPVLEEIGVNNRYREVFSGNVRNYLRKHVELGLLTTVQ